MATSVNSTSSTTSLLTAKTGIGGLVSGMSTDDLVESLTLASRTKVAKQDQLVQSMEWKQTAYRTVSKAVKEFQTKYLDILSNTNMRSESFYNTINATSTSSKISVSGTSSANEGTLTIGAITQLATKQTVTGIGAATSPIQGVLANTTPEDLTSLLTNIDGKSIKLTLDGKVKTITFNKADAENPDFQTAFQNAVDTAFGVTSANRTIVVTVTAGQLGLTSPGSQLTVSALNGDIDTLNSLGLKDGQSNKLTTSKSLGDLGFAKELTDGVDTFKTTINGVKFEFNRTDSLSTVMSRINSGSAGVAISYSSITDKFSMIATNSGIGNNIVITEPETQGNLMGAFGLTGATGAVVDPGKNAKLTVNDVEISRSSNDIEIDGVKISLLATNGALTEDKISITMKPDGSKLLEPIKSFVADYNTMIDLINSLVKENKDSAYSPLTDTQKETMTEKQIETWETKAKAGLLSGDNLLRGIASQMQTMIYGSAVKGGISLYDMGITSAGYSENGKLVIDDAKLKTALETKGSAIKELFTTADTGLANKLNSIITAATKTSGAQGSRGSLIEMAGYGSTMSDTENNITANIEKENKAKTKLETRLKAEETRYWAQFTAMETALSNLNAQSAMLTQFSAG